MASDRYEILEELDPGALRAKIVKLQDEQTELRKEMTRRSDASRKQIADLKDEVARLREQVSDPSAALKSDNAGPEKGGGEANVSGPTRPRAPPPSSRTGGRSQILSRSAAEEGKEEAEGKGEAVDCEDAAALVGAALPAVVTRA